jgi:ATP-dependent DNA ligase
MEAETVEELPSGDAWQYEPKYDGFRCIAHRRNERAHLQSKNQKPLERYFPELAEAVLGIGKDGFVLDGEIVIPGDSFETLQLRLHPAASRIATLSKSHPAQLVAFDLLARTGTPLIDRPLAERRAQLKELADRPGWPEAIRLGTATRCLDAAGRWLGEAGLDGIVAKRLDAPYQPGARAMQKFKVWKTVDCVVGGLYRKGNSRAVESLLLGLYDEDGRLNYVGRARVPADDAESARLVEPLVGGEGFTGRAPGGKNRWSGKERTPVPLQPVLVAEVSADHITGEHMRHGARLLRWRADKSPASCTMDQIR